MPTSRERAAQRGEVLEQVQRARCSPRPAGRRPRRARRRVLTPASGSRSQISASSAASADHPRGQVRHGGVAVPGQPLGQRQGGLDALGGRGRHGHGPVGRRGARAPCPRSRRSAAPRSGPRSACRPGTARTSCCAWGNSFRDTQFVASSVSLAPRQVHKHRQPRRRARAQSAVSRSRPCWTWSPSSQPLSPRASSGATFARTCGSPSLSCPASLSAQPLASKFT